MVDTTIKVLTQLSTCLQLIYMFVNDITYLHLSFLCISNTLVGMYLKFHKGLVIQHAHICSNVVFKKMYFACKHGMNLKLCTLLIGFNSINYVLHVCKQHLINVCMHKERRETSE